MAGGGEGEEEEGPGEKRDVSALQQGKRPRVPAGPNWGGCERGARGENRNKRADVEEGEERKKKKRKEKKKE